MLEQLTKLLYQILPQTKDISITMDTRLAEDLGLGSLHMMLMALALEDAFHVHIPENADLRTVSDVCALMDRSASTISE